MKIFRTHAGTDNHRMNHFSYLTLDAAKAVLRGELGWKRVFMVHIASEKRYLCYPTQAALKAAVNDDGAYTPSIRYEIFFPVSESPDAENLTLVLNH